MRKFVLCIVLGFVSGVAAQTAASAGAPVTPPVTSTAPLTLAQVLDLAHRANPTLLAAEQHLSAVKAQEITAGLRQNPSALVGSQMVTLGPGDPNGTEFYQFGVSRLFERGGKRQARLENARSTTALTSLQLGDQRRQLDLSVRQAFSRMLFAQEAVGISQANLEGYRRTVELMRVRLDAGSIDQTDFERVELQLAGFESDLDNSELALNQSRIGLQTLLGMRTPNAGFAVTGSLDLPDVQLPLEELRQKALANRPDLKAAEQQVDVNATAHRLAVANGTSDPTLEGEYERAGGANTVGGSLNIPLRVFDRNQGEKQRTSYELESSRLALTAARNQVVADVDAAWAAYQAARLQSQRYRSKYLAEAAHVRDNLEFSYRNGNSTLLDYLSALADYRQVNLAALNANLQLALAVEQLSFATNTELVP